MPLEANIVYLDEELKNSRERRALMERFLKDNPAVSVYARSVHGNAYYYKKYWKNGKSVSEFLCRGDKEYKARIKDIEAENKKRGLVKAQLKSINMSIKALQRQLRIAKKAHEIAGH